MTSLLLDTNWSTQSVPFITLPLFAHCSFTHHFHAFFWPHFPPFFSAESQGRLTFQMGEKGGHMVVKTTVSPSPEERKVKQKEWQEGKEEGTGCTEASAAHAWVQRSAFTQLLLLEEILRLLSEGQTPTLAINPLHVFVCLAVYEKTKS